MLDKSRASFFEYTELDPVLHNRNFEVAVPEDAVSTDGPALHHAALNSMRVLYVEVAPWRELLEPGALWDRAFTTPDYGRDPGNWTETGTSVL